MLLLYVSVNLLSSLMKQFLLIFKKGNIQDCIGVSKSCPMIGLENLCHTKLRNLISRVSTPGIFYLLFLLQVLIGSLSYFLYCDWLLRLLTQTTLQFNIYNFFSTNRHVWKWLVLCQRCPLPSSVLSLSTRQ